MFYPLLAFYCGFCHGAAVWFMAPELFGPNRPTTFREAALITATIALAPITVPAAVLFACVMSMIHFDQ